MAVAAKESNERSLSGPQKAAIVISALGPTAAAAIFKALPEEQMEEVLATVAEVEKLPEAVRLETLAEFARQMRSEPTGSAMLADLLEKSVGNEKASRILARIDAAKGEGHAFVFLEAIEPIQAVALLKDERPQVLALILCYLEPKRAAQILAAFDPEVQTQVAMRMGRMDRVRPEIIAKVETVLRKKMGAVQGQWHATGGAKGLAQVLNNVDRTTEKRIFDNLQAKDASLLDDVKKLMLVFDDLATLPDAAAQLVLREVDMADIALALKGAPGPVKELIFRNLSQRATERLKEEIELLGPRPRSEVLVAQERVVAVVRRLEEEGKVKLGRGGESDELLA